MIVLDTNKGVGDVSLSLGGDHRELAVEIATLICAAYNHAAHLETDCSDDFRSLLTDLFAMENSPVWDLLSDDAWAKVQKETPED